MTVRILLFASLPFLFASCGGATNADQQTPGNTTDSPSSEQPVKVQGQTGRKSYTPEELNAPYSRVSPWRYIVTSPETQYFERMVAKSSLAKTVHASGHALLVPEDKTFTENGEWKGILDEGQEEALDRFVKAHIIVGLNSTKSLRGTYENLNGESVSIEEDAQGQLICGGARLLGRELETDRGMVIPVEGLVEAIRWN